MEIYLADHQKLLSMLPHHALLIVLTQSDIERFLLYLRKWKGLKDVTHPTWFRSIHCELCSIRILFDYHELVSSIFHIVFYSIHDCRITTCATVTGSEERCRDALQIAASAFNSLPSSTGIKANEITYSGMIRALLNLMENSDERTKAIAGIFQQCCKDECLNQQLVDILAQATTEDQYLFITGASKTTPIDALSKLHC